MSLRIVGFILLLCSSAPLIGQSQSPEEEPPLEIGTIHWSTDPRYPDTLSVPMTNLSEKYVHAYVLGVFYLDENAENVGGASNWASSEKMPVPGKSDGHAPGETWSEHLYPPNITINDVPVLIAGAQVLVDVVRFADGSTWGPNKSRQAIALGRARGGALAERSRLRRVLEEQGLQALLEDLSQKIKP